MITRHKALAVTVIGLMAVSNATLVQTKKEPSPAARLNTDPGQYC